MANNLNAYVCIVDEAGTPVPQGASGDEAWDGEAPDASAISILKAIYTQNETIIAHLAAIETNTAA